LTAVGDGNVYVRNIFSATWLTLCTGINPDASRRGITARSRTRDRMADSAALRRCRSYRYRLIPRNGYFNFMFHTYFFHFFFSSTSAMAAAFASRRPLAYAASAICALLTRHVFFNKVSKPCAVNSLCDGMRSPRFVVHPARVVAVRRCRYQQGHQYAGHTGCAVSSEAKIAQHGKSTRSASTAWRCGVSLLRNRRFGDPRLHLRDLTA